MTKQRKPDQRPEGYRKWFEAKGVIVSKEKIEEFIFTAISEPFQHPSKESTLAAAAFLFELEQAAKYSKSWDPYKKRIGLRKLKDKGFYPELVTMDHPAFALIYEFLEGKFKEKEMIDRFNNEIYPADERTIRRWIKSIKPRVEKTKAANDYLKTLAPK